MRNIQTWGDNSVVCLNKSIASSSPTSSAIMAYNKKKSMTVSTGMTSSNSKILPMESKTNFFLKALLSYRTQCMYPGSLILHVQVI